MTIFQEINMNDIIFNIKFQNLSLEIIEKNKANAFISKDK
jgi:hypothetical protein